MQKPGDAVIVQTPVFHPLVRAVRGGLPHGIQSALPVNGRYEIDFQDFEAKVKQYHPPLYLMVNPHIPPDGCLAGRSWSGWWSICGKTA